MPSSNLPILKKDGTPLGATEMIPVAQVIMENPGTQTVLVDGAGRMMVNHSVPIVSIEEHVERLAKAGKSGRVLSVHSQFSVFGQTEYTFGGKT